MFSKNIILQAFSFYMKNSCNTLLARYFVIEFLKAIKVTFFPRQNVTNYLQKISSIKIAQIEILRARSPAISRIFLSNLPN